MPKLSEGGVGGFSSFHFLRSTKHSTPLYVQRWWLVDVFRMTTPIEYPICCRHSLLYTIILF